MIEGCVKILGRKKGFTLIELLVVIAIIGTLLAILFPVLSRTRESARRSECTNNLRSVVMGLIMLYYMMVNKKTKTVSHLTT